MICMLGFIWYLRGSWFDLLFDEIEFNFIAHVCYKYRNNK